METHKIIMTSIAVIGLYLSIFHFMHKYTSHRAEFTPKYAYHFHFDIENKKIILKLKLYRTEFPYYITNIELLSSKVSILSYQIKQYFYNNHNMKIKKNKITNTHHLIQSLSESADDNVELTIDIPLISKQKRRRLVINIGYDKYPFGCAINIVIPPNYYTVS